MMVARSSLERRTLAAFDSAAPRIPLVLGGCNSGRTALLNRLQSTFGLAAQYIDLERVATTPERFHAALVRSSPFARPNGAPRATSPREAFDSTVRFLQEARMPNGGPATFLMDEVLELRTFESFPGLRSVMRDFLAGVAVSPNRFVLTSRYTLRAERTLREGPDRFVVVHATPTLPADLIEMVAHGPLGGHDPEHLAQTVLSLANARWGYARMLVEAVAADARATGDPVSVMTALLSRDGRLAARCYFSYELRLHRARGYGALKAILEILADEEPLNLTEIAQRLGRTPGSTKDYLTWLEDVDLVSVQQKRYRFADALLRLWVRLYCRPTSPTTDEVAREVAQYARPRLPASEPAVAFAGAAETTAGREPHDRGKPWGIIEID